MYIHIYIYSLDHLCYKKRLLADRISPKYPTHRDAWNIFLPLIRHLSPRKKLIPKEQL